MSGIGDIVQVTISKNTRTPTRVGFGVPLFLAYHTHNTDKVRTYKELDDLVADGFSTTEAAYLMARAAFSQNPRPPKIKIGRLTTQPTITKTITVDTSTQGDVVKFSVVLPDGSVHDISYTVLGSETTHTVAVAVAALVDALASIAATAGGSGAVVTVTPSTPGQLFWLQGTTTVDDDGTTVVTTQHCALSDTTADANYDDDLTAIRAVDDDWYFVAIDINSTANVELVAAWTEAQVKMFAAQTGDTAELTGGALLGALHTAAYVRTFSIVAVKDVEYPAAAWIGAGAPKDAGSITWAFKALAGITPSKLTATQETHLDTVNGNRYVTIAGLGVTQFGKVSSGEYIDVTHGIDWLTARLQERIFGLLANADKIPFTDASVALFVSEILGELEEAVDRNFLAAGTISASGPKVSTVNPTDRANRHLPNLKGAGNLASAVHTAGIAITVSV